MCGKCGHPLATHHWWSGGGVSGSECSACLYKSKGVYAKTGSGHAFEPPPGYSVTQNIVPVNGRALALVLTSSLVAP